MDYGTVSGYGWMPTGFQSVVALGLWVVFVVIFGVYRSLGDAPQDPIRPPGPLD